MKNILQEYVLFQIHITMNKTKEFQMSKKREKKVK